MWTCTGKLSKDLNILQKRLSMFDLPIHLAREIHRSLCKSALWSLSYLHFYQQENMFEMSNNIYPKSNVFNINDCEMNTLLLLRRLFSTNNSVVWGFSKYFVWKCLHVHWTFGTFTWISLKFLFFNEIVWDLRRRSIFFPDKMV